MNAESRARREWASSQIEALRKQREGLDRKIRELEAFLALLDASEPAVAAASVPAEASLFASPNGNGNGGLCDYIEAALVAAGPEGLANSEVTEAIQTAGYQYPEDRRNPIGDAVRAELYRLS